MKSSKFWLLLPFTFTFTLILHASSGEGDTSISDEKLLPTINIRGTKLYTGIFYKISMKAFPEGWLTLVNSGNYIGLELTPSEQPKYAPGEPLQYDHQWYFTATESDLGYTMTNRRKPLGLLICVQAATDNGKHIATIDDEVSRKKMGPGGEWRKYAIWIIQSTNEGNMYKIENLAMRGHFITWTYKRFTPLNYYTQLADYDYGGDSKFSFVPLNVQLEAKLYDFKFIETLESLIKTKEKEMIRRLVKEKPFPFTDSDKTVILDDTIVAKDSVTIEIKEYLPMARNTKIFINMISDKEFSLEGGFEKNKTKAIEILKTLSLKKEVKVPAHTLVEAKIHTETLKDVEIPFTAKMQIVGFADRIVADQPDKFKEGPIPAEVVEEFISSVGAEMDIISRTGENLVFQVSGTLRGDITARLIGDVAILSKDD